MSDRILSEKTVHVGGWQESTFSPLDNERSYFHARTMGYALSIQCWSQQVAASNFSNYMLKIS